MDSFQLSYSEDDREEWPGLLAFEHVAAILRASPACGAPKESVNAPDAVHNQAGVEALSEMLQRRKTRLGRGTLLGLFGGGGFDSFKTANLRSCHMPHRLLPWSPDRLWAGLQFSGRIDGPVFFQRGKDIVIPQMLLLRGGGSHADQPSCEQMAASAPVSPAFERGDLHRNRSTLLWFGGHSGHEDARTAMLRMHSHRRGFVLIDSLRTKERRDAINMSVSSALCWVPRGQGQGDPTRHMVSIFHGCVPVFSLGRAKQDDALPFEELLPWERFSLRVPTDELRDLPNIVRAAARDGTRLRSMQAELGCAWRALFWTSLEGSGSCFGEPLRGDAFDTLMQVLAHRRSGSSVARPPKAQSACDATARPLPAHLLDADGQLARERLATGTTWLAGSSQD